MKVGALVTPGVLLYAKAGATAAHQKLQFGATPFSLPFAREDVAVRPDARVGVEWAVTDRLSVSVEAGIGAEGRELRPSAPLRLRPREAPTPWAHHRRMTRIIVGFFAHHRRGSCRTIIGCRGGARPAG